MGNTVARVPALQRLFGAELVVSNRLYYYRKEKHASGLEEFRASRNKIPQSVARARERS